MSREQIVEAYIDGALSRRTFIRRLVGVGVSVGAATAYAHLLETERASAADSGARDFYGFDYYDDPEPTVKIRSDKAGEVARTGKLELRLRLKDDAHSGVRFVARARHNGKNRKIAAGELNFVVPAGPHNLEIDVSKGGRKLLRRRRKQGKGTVVSLTAIATDGDGDKSRDTDRRKLKP